MNTLLDQLVLAETLSDLVTPENFTDIKQQMDLLPVEYKILAMRRIALRLPNMFELPSFRAWLMDHLN